MAQFQVDQNHGGFIEKAFRINVAAQYPAFEQQFFESIRGAESKLAQKEKTAILSDVPTAPSSSNGLGQILTHIDISQKFFLACEDTFLVIATALDHQIIHTHRQRKPEEEFIPPAEYSVKTWPSIRSALRVYLKAPASNKQVAAVNVALVLFPEYQHVSNAFQGLPKA
jgi:hypothetical protein